MSSQDALATKSIRASTRKTLLSPRRQSSSSTGSACNTPTKQDPETTKAPSATASPNTTRTSSRRRAYGRSTVRDIPEDASYLSPPQKKSRISDTTTTTTTSSTSSSSRSSRRKRRTGQAEPLLSMPIEPRGNAHDDDLPPANQGPWTDEERIRLEVALKTEPDMRAVVRYVRTRRMPAVRSFAPRNFPELYQQLRDRMEGSTNNNNDKDDDKDEE